jgi:hypothetical protein
MSNHDKLWYVAALIPAAIVGGAYRLNQGLDHWTFTVGLVLMFAYITRLHRRLAALEERHGKST